MPSGLTFALDAQSGRVIVAKVRSTKLMIIVAMVTAPPAEPIRVGGHEK